MCYTGQCRYESYMGDCTITDYNYPDDAECMVVYKEMERKEILFRKFTVAKKSKHFKHKPNLRSLIGVQVATYDGYGDEIGEFMEDIVEKTSGGVEGGALIPISELHPEIGNMRYSDIDYNPLTDNIMTHVSTRKGITLWILPK